MSLDTETMVRLGQEITALRARVERLETGINTLIEEAEARAARWLAYHPGLGSRARLFIEMADMLRAVLAEEGDDREQSGH